MFLCSNLNQDGIVFDNEEKIQKYILIFDSYDFYIFKNIYTVNFSAFML